MNSFEILITLLFIVIIYAAIFKKMTSEMIIGGSALWFVILWIGFDNMGMWSNSPLTHIFEKCGFKSTNQKRKRLNQNKSSYIDYKKESIKSIYLVERIKKINIEKYNTIIKTKKVHKILVCKTNEKLNDLFVNRDNNSILNMKKIVLSYITINQRPKTFVYGTKICKHSLRVL